MNKRTGLLATKLGTTQMFLDGALTAVVALSTKGCVVTAKRTMAKDGYDAVQLGLGDRKDKHTNKPLRSMFAKSNLQPKKHLIEFRVSPDGLLEVGSEILANHFVTGQFVDVVAISKGKGFQGVIKRWNFGGGRASHGNSVSHRSHGSTGNRQDPGRVFKGKKMAGHMGARRVTVQNLKIVHADVEQGLLFVSGAVPGAVGSLVMIKDASKKSRHKDAPFPAALVKA